MKMNLTEAEKRDVIKYSSRIFKKKVEEKLLLRL